MQSLLEKSGTTPVAIAITEIPDKFRDISAVGEKSSARVARAHQLEPASLLLVMVMARFPPVQVVQNLLPEIACFLSSWNERESWGMAMV